MKRRRKAASIVSDDTPEILQVEILREILRGQRLGQAVDSNHMRMSKKVIYCSSKLLLSIDINSFHALSSPLQHKRSSPWSYLQERCAGVLLGSSIDTDCGTFAVRR